MTNFYGCDDSQAGGTATIMVITINMTVIAMKITSFMMVLLNCDFHRKQSLDQCFIARYDGAMVFFQWRVPKAMK